MATTYPGSRRPKGILCPDCAVPMGVRRTVTSSAGVVTRRRECSHCGKRVTTQERAVRGPTPAG